jgi:hypothetical protein
MPRHAHCPTRRPHLALDSCTASYACHPRHARAIWFDTGAIDSLSSRSSFHCRLRSSPIARLHPARPEVERQSRLHHGCAPRALLVSFPTTQGPCAKPTHRGPPAAPRPPPHRQQGGQAGQSWDSGLVVVSCSTVALLEAPLCGGRSSIANTTDTDLCGGRARMQFQVELAVRSLPD